MLRRVALWGPLVIAALLLGGYIYLHQPFARDGTELLPVPLSPDDPALEQVGNLAYRGGLDIPRMGQNIGGLSGLRWDADSTRLLAITDDARWVWITPEETDGRLTGIVGIETGPLVGLAGEVLSGKAAGDSEALVREAGGPWAVAFERDHRIWVYDRGFSEPPAETDDNPVDYLGELEDNSGVEAFATGAQGQLVCAERVATPEAANCVFFSFEADAYTQFPVAPSQALIDLGAVPTDADTTAAGEFLVLFRSYSPSDGNGAGVVAYQPDGSRREIATLRPPLTVDNFEGLAVREEEGATFLYIVSDDNFSGSQRTLLMKFEILDGE